MTATLESLTKSDTTLLFFVVAVKVYRRWRPLRPSLRACGHSSTTPWPIKLREPRCAWACQVCIPLNVHTLAFFNDLSTRMPSGPSRCSFPRPLWESRFRKDTGPVLRRAARAKDFSSPNEASARNKILLRRGSSRGRSPQERLL